MEILIFLSYILNSETNKAGTHTHARTHRGLGVTFVFGESLMEKRKESFTDQRGGGRTKAIAQETRLKELN